MRAVFNRERRTICGSLMQVDLYGITPEEHKKGRGKKLKPSDEKQKARNARHAENHRFLLANANFSECGVYFTGDFKKQYRPGSVEEVRVILGNFVRRVKKQVRREFHLPEECVRVMGVCAAPWAPEREKKAKGNAPHVHILIEVGGMRPEDNPRFRALLENQWRVGRGKLQDRPRMGEPNARQIHMDERLAGLIAYFCNHAAKGEMLWYQSRNLRQPDEKPPNDTRWSAKQLFKARDCLNNNLWWEQKYPGYRLFKAEVMEAPEDIGIDPEEARKARGWYEPSDMPRIRVWMIEPKGYCRR